MSALPPDQPPVQTPAEMLADLRRMLLHPAATAEIKCMALSLAYQIGNAEGRAVGALAGINDMHDAAQAAIHEVMRRDH